MEAQYLVPVVKKKVKDLREAYRFTAASHLSGHVGSATDIDANSDAVSGVETAIEASYSLGDLAVDDVHEAANVCFYPEKSRITNSIF